MSDVPTVMDSTDRAAAPRRWITILFTDIVDSTRHWHELGDVETRYRIEQHNASLIPLVEGYDGTVVKTIGDSIMASFDDPENAVRSAIAMQHALHEVREKDPDFELKVRIGIHRGRAIVEDDDVYGNTVNVASRVESQAQGDEILVSGAVAQHLDQDRYYLSRRGSYTPRGKSNSILLYRVSWWRTECLLEKVPRARSVVVGNYLGLRVARALGPVAINVAGLAFLFSTWGPLWLASRPGWQAVALNPFFSARHDPATIGGLVLGAGFVLAFVACASWVGLRSLRALAVAWLVFALVEGVGHQTSIEWPGQWRRDLEVEGVEWVEVQSVGKVLHAKPSIDAPVVARLEDGQRLPLNQRTRTRRGAPWLRVSFAPEYFAWMPDEGGDATHRVVPAVLRPIVSRDVYAASLAVLAGLARWIRAGPRDPRKPGPSV